MGNPLLWLGRRIAVASRLDPELRMLLIEAAWRLMVIKIVFSILSFRQQRRFFGRAVPPSAGQTHNATILLDEEQIQLARQIGWAVWRAELHLPVEVACLPMALVARRMLSKRGIDSVMTFGAEQDKPVQDIGTHAWLDAGCVKVSGYPLATSHSPFVAFLLA